MITPVFFYLYLPLLKLYNYHITCLIMGNLFLSMKRNSLFHHLKQLFYPHEHNNHHPKAIRHSAVATYTVALLIFHISYNVFFAHSSNLLGFATAISQPVLIQLTNQQRAAAGVGLVTESALLDKSALLKAQNMFAEDYWAHFAPSGKSPWYWFDQAGYSYTLAGENLARDFDTSQGVITGWMNSPSHRANLLAPGYKDIGMAVLNGTLQGHETTLVVQHFGTPVTLSASNGSTIPTTPLSTGSKTTPQSGSAPQAIQQPTPVPVQDSALSQETLRPLTTGSPGVPLGAYQQLSTLPYNLLHPQPVTSWGVQQTVTIVFLFTLMLLFLFDSVVIQRKGIVRAHSHSFLHAGMMGVLLILVVYSTIGGVL